jgi:diguanylate cyclase (GGDEF)-like protein
VRTLARVATSSLAALCIGLELVVVAVATIGILGTRSSTILGKEISTDELTTSTTTGELARDMDSAYATGEEAFLSSDPARRSRLLGWLYTSLLPGTGARLSALEQLHAGDPPAEYADFEQFVRQWTVVRDLLSPTSVADQPDAALASRLAAAYLPVGAHLDRLFLKEQDDGRGDQLDASANGTRTTWLVVAGAVTGITLGVLLLLFGVRRIRRTLEPGQDQAEFADTLQIANDEGEAHRLLQRHLERILASTTAVVLNRNNSADRLEAIMPLPSGSPLAGTLRGAEPRSCLAVRSGRTHREVAGRPALLSCPVCGPCPGASSCLPLIVGGEVIGSVLLIHPTPYDQSDERRIRESVGQAAPVLANLRNLAIAELRAATDGLTGLPNKRAVTDALKRLFAQASTTSSPLGLLLLDLDHFKQVNDQRGHAVGDQVLANVGAVLRSVLRTRDFAGRNGGEEFAILLPDTEIQMALLIAERVRTAIAEISLPGTNVAVTASIGVAGFPDHASTPDRLERLADAALYLAKRQGRNRVELAETSAVEATADLPEPPEPPRTVPQQLSPRHKATARSEESRSSFRTGGGSTATGLPARVPAGTAGPAGPAGPAGAAGPPAEQVEDEQQDGCADDGGEPGVQVEEPVQGVNVEQAGGYPAAGQRTDDADHAGQNETL